MTQNPPHLTQTLSSSDGEYVALRGGLALPACCIALACRLESSGVRLTVDGDRLRATNQDGGKPVLSEGDVSEIRRWKAHLMALVCYTPPSAT